MNVKPNSLNLQMTHNWHFVAEDLWYGKKHAAENEKQKPAKFLQGCNVAVPLVNKWNLKSSISTYYDP